MPHACADVIVHGIVENPYFVTTSERGKGDGLDLLKKRKATRFGNYIVDYCNYTNPNITDPKGECKGIVLGCNEPGTLNFDADVTVNDGSCIYKVAGCTDSTAVNYYSKANNVDETAADPDGSGPKVAECTYPIFGCTTNYAINYNANATQDDGSCEVPPPDPRCEDSTALNYLKKGDCIFEILGCMDPGALNYDSTSNTDYSKYEGARGSCIQPVPGADRTHRQPWAPGDPHAHQSWAS